MDKFFNGIIGTGRQENIILYWYKIGYFSNGSKPNHFVPLINKISYKRKKKTGTISIQAPKKIKLNKVTSKKSRIIGCGNGGTPGE